MSDKFIACTKQKGRKMITKVPKPGKYIHICYPPGGGSPIAGEVKTTKGGKGK